MEQKKNIKSRQSGILVHPTSFPGPFGIGDLGKGAYDFIDFLAASGQHLWQVLPLGPTGFGDSPYQGFSAFAGQPLIISPDLLIKMDLLTKEDIASCEMPQWDPRKVDYGPAIEFKTKLLKKGEAFGTLPVPVYKGYYFLGWYTRAGKGGTKITSKSKLLPPEE